MGKKKILLIWILLFLLAGISAIHGDTTGRAKPVSSAGDGPVPPDLLGSWHTVSLHGDCLFLILREIMVNMSSDHRFSATVVFRENTRESMNGTFEVEGKTLVFHSEDNKEHGKAHYSFRKDKNVLVVHDKQFGVTIELKRMKNKP